MVDAWESLQPGYTRTADVLDHFNEEINGDGGVLLADGPFFRDWSCYSILISLGVDRLEEDSQDYAAGGWRFDSVFWRAWRMGRT